MRKSVPARAAWFIVAPLALCAVTALAASGVLFEDDFELGQLDESKWVPSPNWQVVAPEAAIPGLGTGVLDFSTGEANISQKNDFADFVFEVDFKAGPNAKITGFVMRAEDAASNFYMHQISAEGSGHTPNNIRWHWKVGGGWNVEAIPFEGGETVDPDVWYRARWIVDGADFECYVLESDAFWQAPGQAKMRLLGTWTDDKDGGKAFYEEGAVGFRASGGEDMQFDNVLVYDLNGDPFAVGAKGKLAAVWGHLKQP